jgi:hypothetical protein
MVKYVYYIQRVQEEDVEGLLRVTRDQKPLLTVETEGEWGLKEHK